MKKYIPLALGLLFIISLVIRLKYAFINGIWIDEGRYALIGRALLEHPFSYSTMVHGKVTSYPPLLPFLLFLSQGIFGAGDFAIRLVNPLLGAISVLATYYLGKILYDERVGMIAGILMAVAPYNLFFSERVLLEIPHLLFFTLTIALFYDGWENNDNRKLYASAVALTLGALTKQPNLIALPVILTYLLLFYRLDWLKSRKLWKTFGLFLLLMTPWSARSVLACGKISCETSHAFSWFLSNQKGGLDVVFDPLYYVKLLPWILNKWVLVLAFLGLFSWQNNKKQHTLLLLWFSWIMFVFSITPVKVPRYVISIIVPGVTLAAVGIIDTARSMFDKKLEWVGATIVLVLVLSYFSYAQGTTMIVAKAPGFAKLKDAGEFFLDMPKNTVILSAAPTIISFYAGNKRVIPYPEKAEDLAQYIYNNSVDYVILDAYERTQPAWTFSTVPNLPYLIPIKGFQQNGKTVVVIFKVNESALKKEV